MLAVVLRENFPASYSTPARRIPPRNDRTIMTDTNETAANRPWHEIVLATLKANDVRLIVYVPDRVLTQLIAALHADDFFRVFAATREEEDVGIVSGAFMAGMRVAVLMHTSGFATLPNVIASLVAPSQ